MPEKKGVMGSWEVEETVCSTPSRLDTFYGFYTQAARQAGTVRNPGTHRLHTAMRRDTQTGIHTHRQTHGQADEGKDSPSTSRPYYIDSHQSDTVPKIVTQQITSLFTLGVLEHPVSAVWC